jgi:hypothetical protein
MSQSITVSILAPEAPEFTAVARSVTLTSSSGPLTINQSVYNYTNSSAFPSQSNGSHGGIGSNYGVDFVFNATPLDYPCGTSGTFQVVNSEVVGNNSCTGSAKIPEGITSIAANSFAYSQVNALTLPSTLTAVGENAFQNSSIKELVLPSAVSSIGAAAFTANSITTLVIPSSVQTIGDNAFSGNPITSLTLPGTPIQMGAYVFKGNSLTSLAIPVGMTRIYQDEFSGDPSLTSLTLPDGLTTIDKGAFYGDGLSAVTIPDSVNSIGAFAFDMSSLNSVIYCGVDTGVASYPFASSTVTAACTRPKISLSSSSVSNSVGSAMTPVTVTNSGGPIAGFTVTPTLPAGIAIDSDTGTALPTVGIVFSALNYLYNTNGFSPLTTLLSIVPPYT